MVTKFANSMAGDDRISDAIAIFASSWERIFSIGTRQIRTHAYLLRISIT